jgi:hypothetical protein
MNAPDPIIGRRLFVDVSVRPVFTDDAGAHYVIGPDGQTRLYGVWLQLETEADPPLVMTAHE